MNLWQRYNPDVTLFSVIQTHYGLELKCQDEGDLYALVKRHLTRRELRCFVMERGGEAAEAIAAALHTDVQGVQTLSEKIRKKFRRPVLTEALRRCGEDASE